MMKNAPDKVRENLLQGAVFPKRFGLPEEFAKFVGQIIENPMINADTLQLEGAMRMRSK